VSYTRIAELCLFSCLVIPCQAFKAAASANTVINKAYIARARSPSRLYMSPNPVTNHGLEFKELTGHTMQ